MDGSSSLAGAYAQAPRQLAVQTPLGADAFLLEGMDGSEGLSTLFAYTLRVRSFQDSVDPAALINKRIDWQLRTEGDDWRPFNGMVASYSGGEAMARGQRSFRVTAVPWLWFLQHKQDSRVFQNLSVPQIAAQLFDEIGCTDYDTSGLAQQYKPRQYCVQYRETDFNFVSRLFEEEGIFYSWKHERGKHTLMLADGAHAYRDLPDGSLPYNPPGIFKNSVTSWNRHQTFRAGKTTTGDYDFQNPGNSLLATTTGSSPVPSAEQYEIFDFPGRYVSRDHGEKVSGRMMAGHEKGQDTVSSSSNCRNLQPGHRFGLEAHPVAGENVSYAISSVTHHASDPSYESVAKGAPSYHNTFTCLPATVDYTPEQRSEKPAIPGIQSAVVTGPKGEEIYTDRYGRVKVQFHWDRKGRGDESSSCWLRVAQPWAGKGFGAQTIPRVGMEVLVGFMEGDPDHPVVIGSLPNANTVPSVKLPDEKERTAFRSASSPGGDGFNELTFEDRKGSEEVFLHAQKDMSELVKNNRMLSVGNVHHQSAETLFMSTVHDSVVEQTQDHILLKHGSSQIYLDAGQVRINFGSGHVLTLDGNGVHLHSSTRVDASQGQGSSASNWVSITTHGVDTNGQAVNTTAGSGGQSRTEMADGGIKLTGPDIWMNS